MTPKEDVFPEQEEAVVRETQVLQETRSERNEGNSND
jgi:hypothetical protein